MSIVQPNSLFKIVEDSNIVYIFISEYVNTVRLNLPDIQMQNVRFNVRKITAKHNRQ